MKLCIAPLQSDGEYSFLSATSTGMLIGLHTIPMSWGWSFTAVLGLWVIIMGVVINHVNKIMAKVELVSEEEHFEAKT